MTRKNPLSISAPTILTSRTALPPTPCSTPQSAVNWTQTPDTGDMEFTIRKGRLSFRLTAPYSEKRKQAAREAAKTSCIHKKVAEI